MKVSYTEKKRIENAATKIQSVYRGHQARNRIKKLNKAATKIQEFFKACRKEKLLSQNELLQRVKAKNAINQERLEKFRKLHSKHYEALEALSPEECMKYTDILRDAAATKIQSKWRSHKAIKGFKVLKEDLKQKKAARVIQRNIRQWISEKRIKKTIEELECKLRSDESLLMKLERWKLDHPIKVPKYMWEEVSKGGLDCLKWFYISMNGRKNQIRHLTTLQLQLDSDLKLLTKPLSMGQVSINDSYCYFSSNVPIAIRAKDAHERALARLKLPWCQRMFDEEESS